MDGKGSRAAIFLARSSTRFSFFHDTPFTIEIGLPSVEMLQASVNMINETVAY
jgi:hypothetical protein